MSFSTLELVHHVDFSTKNDQENLVQYLLPADGVQNFVIIFNEDEQENSGSIRIKGGENGARMILSNWANVEHYNLTQPRRLGHTDAGRAFYMNFSLRTEHQYYSERFVKEDEQQVTLGSALLRNTIYHFSFDILIDPENIE